MCYRILKDFASALIFELSGRIRKRKCSRYLYVWLKTDYLTTKLLKRLPFQ